MSASDHTALRRLDATGLPLLLSRLVLGGMFIWLGASKISDPISFLKLIREYGLVPPDMSVVLNGMAVALPWLEIWCGVLLLLGVALRGAGASTLLLLCIFSLAILLRALDIYATGGQSFCEIKFDCGCGAGEQFVCAKLPENLGLMLLSFVVLWSKSRRFCLASRLPKEPS
ncbi:MAG: DoxX family membrane protein [Planctomycetota bacterium]|nr:DoxX family membrane protein [Planctomycetota bacterium]